MSAHEPTLLGAVESVSGAAVTVRLLPAAASGLTYVGGHGFRVGQVGNFVRIEIGLLDLFGVISQIGAGAAPQPLTTDEPYGHRWMTIQLVGEAQPGQSFERGLSEYPTVGDSVHLLTEPDLARLYGETDEVRHVRIGQLAGGSSIPARVNIERLLTRHAAVVGATGSGKSSTVARILTCVIDGARYPSARALLFDLHGEYPRAFPRDAGVLHAVARSAIALDSVLGFAAGHFRRAVHGADSCRRVTCVPRRTRSRRQAPRSRRSSAPRRRPTGGHSGYAGALLA